MCCPFIVVFVVHLVPVLIELAQRQVTVQVILLLVLHCIRIAESVQEFAEITIALTLPSFRHRGRCHRPPPPPRRHQRGRFLISLVGCRCGGQIAHSS